MATKLRKTLSSIWIKILCWLLIAASATGCGGMAISLVSQPDSMLSEMAQLLIYPEYTGSDSFKQECYTVYNSLHSWLYLRDRAERGWADLAELPYNYYYYATIQNKVLTNCPGKDVDFFTSLRYHTRITQTDGYLEQSGTPSLPRFGSSSYGNGVKSDFTLYYGFDDASLAAYDLTQFPPQDERGNWDGDPNTREDDPYDGEDSDPNDESLGYWGYDAEGNWRYIYHEGWQGNAPHRTPLQDVPPTPWPSDIPNPPPAAGVTPGPGVAATPMADEPDGGAASPLEGSGTGIVPTDASDAGTATSSPTLAPDATPSPTPLAFTKTYEFTRHCDNIADALNDWLVLQDRAATGWFNVPYGPVRNYYYVEYGGKIESNCSDNDKSFFEGLSQHSVSQRVGDQYTSSGTLPAGYAVDFADADFTAYFGFDNAELAAYQTKWTSARTAYSRILTILLCCLTLGGAALVMLCIGAGRSPRNDELRRYPLDRAFSELLILLWLTMATASLAVPLYMGFARGMGIPTLSIVPIVGFGLAVLTAWGHAACLLSLVRTIKAKRLLRQSVLVWLLVRLWRVVCWIGRMMRSVASLAAGFFNGRAYAKKPTTKQLFYSQMAFVCAGAVLVLLLAIANPNYDGGWVFLIILLLLVLTGLHIAGNLRTFRKINKGFDDSSRQITRAESSQTALITNVSHDLKTPLTSIVTYLELLGQEEMSDAAKDYVTVLTDKSQQLKHMVFDLFELSKSVSGNLSVNLEVLDFNRLLCQTLADMKDALDASGLSVRTRLPTGNVMIEADGRRMYRVLQNIISNAIAYAQPGSRFYVQLDVENGVATAAFLNIAAHEMTFTAEEIMQRFVRGDGARSSEGSGLGLSIAQSFTAACGGRFDLSIEGDLFKVMISFGVVGG